MEEWRFGFETSLARAEAVTRSSGLSLDCLGCPVAVAFPRQEKIMSEAANDESDGLGEYAAAPND